MATNREIRIPAESFHALGNALAQELGAEACARAMQEAGFSAGDALHDRLTRGAPDEDLAATSSASFWDRLSVLFRELGWGTVRYEELHPGVGALVASDWFEAAADGGANCPFSTGVLANVLGRVAGDEVAVMQVTCDPPTDGCARFLFGRGPVLQDVYEGLVEGRDLATSLGSLG